MSICYILFSFRRNNIFVCKAIIMDIQNYIPAEIINFFLVLVFSLLIGLGQRRLHLEDDEKQLFGTDRTFTFIGLLGYVLFLTGKGNFIPFLTGFVIIGILLGIQYFLKIRMNKNFGLTTSILALLTYCLPVMIFTQPIWLVLSFVVSILILTEMKSLFISLSKKASEEEFITLSKFIAFAGIILPLLPSENISDIIPVSPYTIWLAIMVVSGISYISYLIKAHRLAWRYLQQHGHHRDPGPARKKRRHRAAVGFGHHAGQRNDVPAGAGAGLPVQPVDRPHADHPIPYHVWSGFWLIKVYCHERKG